MHSRKGIAVQSLSRVQLFAAPWTAAHQAPLSFTISETSPRVMSVSQWCYLTTSSSSALFSSCPQVFPNIRVSSKESALRIRWPKYWSFSFSINPSNEWRRLSRVFSNTTVQKHQFFIQLSAFFLVQLSPPYMTMDAHSSVSTRWQTLSFTGAKRLCVIAGTS